MDLIFGMKKKLHKPSPWKVTKAASLLSFKKQLLDSQASLIMRPLLG